jgi:hypothetical protein
VPHPGGVAWADNDDGAGRLPGDGDAHRAQQPTANGASSSRAHDQQGSVSSDVQQDVARVSNAEQLVDIQSRVLPRDLVAGVGCEPVSAAPAPILLS